MASNMMPIPEPPRTPSPPPDDEPFDSGSLPATPGIHAQQPFAFGLTRDSPERFSTAGGGSFSHASLKPPSLGSIEESQQLQPEAMSGPFAFQSQTSAPAGTVRSNIGQRRGHKYKHSSVSHQIFQEPAPKQPLRLPASLPVPTFSESYRSMTRPQRLRIGWCICHLLVAGVVQFQAQGSLAITSLSHLIFYDAVGALLSSIVDVLSNFEVWKRTSIRHPFGLERSEVVVGFAMSILLLFMGFDIISHGAGHYFAELPGDHEPHRPHKHEGRVTALGVNMVVGLAVSSTLLSAVMLQNHARISRSLRVARFQFLPPVLRSPSHLLTLSCAGVLLLMPLLDEEKYNYFDRVLATAVAAAMCTLGFQLVKNLGAMLLMSFNPLSDSDAESSESVSSLLREISADPAVQSIDDAKFWQVHYGLCIAALKMKVRGNEDTLNALRAKVVGLVRLRLGGGKGSTDAPNWEVSTEFEIEKD